MVETAEPVEVACLVCDWEGTSDEAIWHDLSDFHDDSMCDDHEGSGWFECPDCGEVCQVLD